MRAARVDRNHGEIVKAARKLGCLVWSTAAVGKGFPDLVICLPKRLGRRVVLCEVKDGTKPPSARKLTPDEAVFASQWPVTLITCMDDLLKLLKEPLRSYV